MGRTESLSLPETEIRNQGPLAELLCSVWVGTAAPEGETASEAILKEATRQSMDTLYRATLVPGMPGIFLAT